MNSSIYKAIKLKINGGHIGKRGASTVEFVLILPVMLTMFCAIIDLGRLIQARLVLTNVAREGGSLGSRDIQSAANLISMLQSAASPLDIKASGKIYIWKIRAGTTEYHPNPTIDLNTSKNGGDLSVLSSIGTSEANLGLTPALYDQLVFDPDENKNTANISEVTVVEVFYKYMPITPLSFIPWLPEDGIIISSKAEF